MVLKVCCWGFRAMKTLVFLLLFEILALGVLPISGKPATADELFAEPTLHSLFLYTEPSLPPMGHSRFCLRYTNDCAVHGIDFRRRNIALSLVRALELNSVNRAVNRAIIPTLTDGDGSTEEWQISPRTGDCKSYAITKRHELLAHGWPSRALLLAEVVIPSGEHHLVLIVRVKGADLVLDNLTMEIRSVEITSTEYRWLRVESPQNPRFWELVSIPVVIKAALLSK